MREGHAEPGYIVLPPYARFRHSFLFQALSLLILGLPMLLSWPYAQAQSKAENVSLTVSLAPDTPEDAVVSPPPGTYDIPMNDFVLLQGRGGAKRDCGTVWSGDMTGTDVSVSLRMDGAKHVTASMGGKPPTSEKTSPVFDAPDKNAMHAFLGSGGMHGWFSADRSQSGVGAGITHLVTSDNPCFPIFARPNLNFEHIVNGAAADRGRAFNTPRTDPMQIRVLSPACVELCWPAATSSWSIDCRMRYTFSGENAIDMEFEATPRKDEAPKGWLLFMWASYMQMTRARTIYFRGIDGGDEKWMSFGSTGKSGTVAGGGQADLPQDEGYQGFNAEVVRDVRFSQPFYYGLRDADMDPGTTEDTMAYIMMFDDPMTARFAVWNWGDDPTVSAWDWQFVIRNPEIGKTYRQRSRMVYKHFSGQEDVLAEYRAWRERLAQGIIQPSLPIAACPVHLAPGNSAFSHGKIMGKVAEEDPALALVMCKGMLSSTLHAEDAASRIDKLLEKEGGTASAARQWATIAAEQPLNTLVWRHLGAAAEKQGDLARAAQAYARVLDIDGADRAAKLRLGVLRVRLGETESGLALVGDAVPLGTDLARATAMECAGLGETVKKSGDVISALALYRLAVICSPENNAYRMPYGEALESDGDLEGALEQYRSAVENSPESASYAASRIDAVYRGRGDAPGLVLEWKFLSDTLPTSFMAAFHLGLALEAAEDRLGAETAYNEALNRCPDRTEAKVRLVGLVAARGDVKNALGSIVALTADGGEEVMNHAGWACGSAAKARVTAGDLPGAVALLRRARQFSPADLGYRVSLGEALEAAGDDEGALLEYRAVAAEAPDAPHSGDRIDAIYGRRADPTARVAEWKRMVEAHPAAAVPRIRLGLALEAADDKQGAETVYREALALNAAVNANSPLFLQIKNAARGGR